MAKKTKKVEVEKPQIQEEVVVKTPSVVEEPQIQEEVMVETPQVVEQPKVRERIKP